MSCENPPTVAFFQKHLLFGTKSKLVSVERDEAVNKAVSIVSQILGQKVKTDKQVKHQPKLEVQFVTHTQTPLSVGLALSMCNKVWSICCQFAVRPK